MNVPGLWKASIMCGSLLRYCHDAAQFMNSQPRRFASFVGMKAFRISFPSSLRIGMFCRFGLLELSRPLAVTVWLKDVWMRPVAD